MGPRKSESISRRRFLRQMGWAPGAYVCAPFLRPLLWPGFAFGEPAFPASLADSRLTPRYPEGSPLDAVLRWAEPGTDEFVGEGYAAEIQALLAGWSQDLRSGASATTRLKEFLYPSLRSTSLRPTRETPLRPGDPIEVVKREFAAELLPGSPRFVSDVRMYFASLKRVETADFEIYECAQTAESPLSVATKIRYDIMGWRDDRVREERIGSWLTRWSRDASGTWRAVEWAASQEIASRAAGPIFVDITSQALGQTQSYREQLLKGADHWRTVLDGAIGVDVYGNNGLAAGDYDNDGLDDLYVCQPAGLPNRLYRNRGDGTFEDVTANAGVDVLDFTACALFADFENRGLQDLLVVCATGPLLFRNSGNGKFALRRDAFRFARPPQGAFTHAAIADYDRDGRLDIYFCLYTYYQGLDQYRYPVPYFDARNGPPNYLFHNEGDGLFEDRTEAAGLNVENDRYSFACCWGDSQGNGWPDLYVVNDFGRNNLYRNNGNGTFEAASEKARVDEAGAGMSACWLDFDNDGKQDIYAAGMWVAAGQRIFGDPHFHPQDAQSVRELYRRHMAGNSLYRNLGDGSFQNVAMRAGVEMGRWSWSTDAWDFDHDGFPDLYIANGYISSLDRRDVSSFFWRQVVAKSPADATPSSEYERGWGAMNELIRSDSTWNGHERNVFYANNRDGTFSDVSGVVGLDFRDDSRAFALADLDGDGRLEIVLKNRTAPQVRILSLAIQDIGNSVVLRLRGRKSNRDAIGTAVTMESGGLRQTKYLQAGSGFLSQHTKEIVLGVGKSSEAVKVTIRWPSGLVQVFEKVPINRRLEIDEGSEKYRSRPFAVSAKSRSGGTLAPSAVEGDFASGGTWLIEPVKAPDFTLSDTAGSERSLRSFEGKIVLLCFWASDSEACLKQLGHLREARLALSSSGLQVVAVNVDDPIDLAKVRSYAEAERFQFPVLAATPNVAGMYNIVFRYMFDRHRDLPLPTAFLLDEGGNIVKVFPAGISTDELLKDAGSIPRTAEARFRQALPFPGSLLQDKFQRNSFTYGVAFAQHGFLDAAAESFQRVLAEKPEDPDAYYNLGTLYLRRNSHVEARQYLEGAVKFRPDYPEAWNNLGMLSAQEGNPQEAIHDFQRCLELRPSYATALLNLGNVYRRQGSVDEAQEVLERALAIEPTNPEANYSLGMLFARQEQRDRARQYLEKAIALRPDYTDALNNLGVMLVQEQRYPEAQARFEACIQTAPDFDQGYLNLARVYLLLNEKEKARKVLQTLLQKQPQHAMAQQMLQMLY